MQKKKPTKKKAAPKAKKKTAKKKAVSKRATAEAVRKKEELFARYYALHNNAAKAYRLSGYKSTKPECDRTYAYRLLQKDHIQELVERYRQLIEQKLDIREDRILAELSAIGFSDITETCEITPAGLIRVRNLDELPPHARVAIKSIKMGRRMIDGQWEDTLEIKLHDKVKALERLTELKGMDKRPKAPPSVRVNLNFDNDRKLKDVEVEGE